jgi:hypothetical protein
MDEVFHVSREIWERLFGVPYTVELQNWPGLSAAQRAAIETRFVVELERSFGGPEGVMRAFGEECAAFEEHDATASRAREAMVTAWRVAERDAKQVALQGFEAPSGVRFWLSFYDAEYERPE